MSIPSDNTIPCERCGISAELASTIPPFGTTKGARIYGCTACQHFTWVDWHGDDGQQQPPQAEKPKS